ncbi:MAG: hypothetical protein M1541_04285, partial [Acidobacteria bacterium]|nr:hypothetical protein [Acidobacteriota bacterium]
MHRNEFGSAAIICGLLCAVAAVAAPVQIVDTIKTPFSGVLFSGTVTIVGPQLTTASGETVARWQADYTVTNGVFSVQLEPNDAASPSGTSYSVRYFPDRSKSKVAAWSETWVVPTSAGPLKVNQVRVASAPTPSVLIALSQLGKSGAQQGQAVVWNGTAWAPAWGNGVPLTEGPQDGQYLKWNAALAAWEPVTFVDQETPAGSLDGVNAVFALAGAPAPAGGAA